MPHEKPISYSGELAPIEAFHSKCSRFRSCLLFFVTQRSPPLQYALLLASRIALFTLPYTAEIDSDIGRYFCPPRLQHSDSRHDTYAYIFANTPTFAPFEKVELLLRWFRPHARYYGPRFRHALKQGQLTFCLLHCARMPRFAGRHFLISLLAHTLPRYQSITLIMLRISYESHAARFLFDTLSIYHASIF